MKAAPTLCGAVLTVALTATFTPANAQQANPPTTLSSAADRMLERRAVDAVICKRVAHLRHCR
jgi:hypothetical protein